MEYVIVAVVFCVLGLPYMIRIIRSDH